MRVLLVGHGLKPIPCDGWGAVENIIYRQATSLRDSGNSVDILNLRRPKALLNVLLKRKLWSYDLVHLHVCNASLEWSILSKVYRFKLAVTTHRAIAAHSGRWNETEQKVFRRMLRIPNLILISQEMADVMRERGYKGNIYILPNAAPTNQFKFAPKGNGKIVMLGRVDERKNQLKVAELLEKHPDLRMDIIGPLGIDKIDLKNPNVQYLGSWTQTQVKEHLTEYSVLGLLSSAEGMALVGVEAMAAGLSLVFTQEAGHGFPYDVPWIYRTELTKPEQWPDVLRRAVQESDGNRASVRRYCESNFDIGVTHQKYLQIVEDITRSA